MAIVNSHRTHLVLIATGLLGLCSFAFAIQEKPKKEQPVGVPVLWQEPKDIATRNLYLGPGGEAMKPNLSNVTIIEEKESGSRSLKFRVRDGSGRAWQAKVGDETRAETAANRLVWATGYYTDVTYLEPSVAIEGRGTLRNVRFEARPKAIKRLNEWSWEDNPFLGSTEVQGLKVLLALLENWNLKNENNKIIFAGDDETARAELRFIVSDFDVRQDKAVNSPSFWYRIDSKASGARFIERVKENLVEFNYNGPHKERLAGITVAQAKWIGNWLSRLTDQQIRDALRAANFGSEESKTIEKELRGRINELNALK
jgi:hypothetical protein